MGSSQRAANGQDDEHRFLLCGKLCPVGPLFCHLQILLLLLFMLPYDLTDNKSSLLVIFDQKIHNHNKKLIQKNET